MIQAGQWVDTHVRMVSFAYCHVLFDEMLRVLSTCFSCSSFSSPFSFYLPEWRLPPFKVGSLAWFHMNMSNQGVEEWESISPTYTDLTDLTKFTHCS